MIKQLKEHDKYWDNFISHLKRANMYQHVAFDKYDYIFLAKIVDNDVVGHISTIKEPLEIPSLKKKPIKYNSKELFEYYVQTFFVDENYRRKGYGKELQKEAYRLSCKLGAYQLRSWSSYDKMANYQLKLSLGFAIHPGHTYVSKTNQYIPGVYFVKTCSC